MPHRVVIRRFSDCPVGTNQVNFLTGLAHGGTLQNMSLVDDSDRRHLRALSHPLRLRILSMLTGAPKSATELGRELQMSQAAVSFHVRQLASAGLIELVDVRRVRGGQERLYRTSGAFADGVDVDLPSSAAAASAEVTRRLLATRPSNWDLFSDAELWVAEDSWLHCARTVARALERLHKAASPTSTPGSIHVSSTVMMFRARDEPVSRRRTTRTEAVTRAPESKRKRAASKT